MSDHKILKYHMYTYYADETSDTYPNISTTAPLTTVSTTQTKVNNAATTMESEIFRSSPVASNTIAGSVIGVIIAILLLVAVVLLVVVLIQQRKQKHFTVESNGDTYPNPAYDGKSLSIFNAYMAGTLIDRLN